MKLQPLMFNPKSDQFKYSGWTSEPTLEDSFNHESGAFVSFGEEESLIMTHDKFDLEFFFHIAVDHFESIFREAGIQLNVISPELST